MTQKEFIEVAIGGGNHIMVSISSIAFVQPANNGGARINMKLINPMAEPFLLIQSQAIIRLNLRLRTI